MLSQYTDCMRFLFLTGFLATIWLMGCSQNAVHNDHDPAKIPIHANRWYVLNTTNSGIEQLFDNISNRQPSCTHGNLLKTFEAWYPLEPGETMEIDSIKMFDYEGTGEETPMTIFAIDDHWKRVEMATFTGSKYDRWVGPNPESPDDYRLKTPIGNIRYLVIKCAGLLPTELEFYGRYHPPAPYDTPHTVKHYPLRNFLGVNGFEWDFCDPHAPDVLAGSKLEAMKSFAGFRHYLDWERIEPMEGAYCFNPSKNGGWNYDAIYSWCKSNNVEVLACLKNNPPWMLATYPENMRDGEDIPTKFGADQSEPSAYLEQARAAFQFAARYGRNKEIFASTSDSTGLHPLTSLELVRVDTILRWAGDRPNRPLVGLDLVRYIECNNETDKWWKGSKCYQTAREYAANLSAFYDGDQGRLGPAAGVKKADSSMLVVMAGMANATTDYLRGMVDWCKEHRGYRPDGSVDVPWDVVNYHYYSCEYAPANLTGRSKPSPNGVAPEASLTSQLAAQFLGATYHNIGRTPVWVTESGYDIDQRSSQCAVPIGEKTVQEVQADWILRTVLCYARTGIERLFFYELHDDNPNGIRYGSSGLVNDDASPRPAATFLRQLDGRFGGFAFQQSLSALPVVDRYQNADTPMYVLYMPTQSGKTTEYLLQASNIRSAEIYIPTVGKPDMAHRTLEKTGDVYHIPVSETPVFVVTHK